MKDFGWRYFEKLAKGGAIAAKGNGAVIEAVARGEKAYGVIIEYMAFNAQWKGSPVDFVFPQEGVSAITQPVAILKTARNVEAARAFVDWQLSEEAQHQSVSPGLFPDLSRRRAAQGLSATCRRCGSWRATCATSWRRTRRTRSGSPTCLAGDTKVSYPRKRGIQHPRAMSKG